MEQEHPEILRCQKRAVYNGKNRKRFSTPNNLVQHSGGYCQASFFNHVNQPKPNSIFRKTCVLFNICINYLLHYLLFSVLVNLSPDDEDTTFSSLSRNPLMEFLSYSWVALAPHRLNVLRCIQPSGKGHLWSWLTSQQYFHCLEQVGVLFLLSKSIGELDGCESDGLPADLREPGIPLSSLSGSSSKYSISADIWH